MRKGWKILVGVLIALAVLVGVNALVTDAETKSAEVTVPGGRVLHLQGGDLQVVEGGPRDGAPIVLVHCFTCAIDWWDAMRPALERRHRVVAVDLLGFGGSQKPASGYSMENQADLVAQALSRLDVDHATVVGHSLGGTVVVALAERSPDLVDKVVIVDQAPNNDDYEKNGLPVTAALTFIPVVGPALWRVTPDFAIRDGLGAAFAPGYEVPDAFIEDFRRQTYTSYDESARAEDDYVSAEPLDRRLRGLRIPLLATFGAEEQIFLPRKALNSYASVPGSETRLVAGAGHSPNVERPARTASLVLAFAGEGPRVQDHVQNGKPVRPRP